MKQYGSPVWLAGVLAALPIAVAALVFRLEPESQILSLTTIPGRIECPGADSPMACAVAYGRRFVEQHPGVATRENGDLWVHLLNGRRLSIEQGNVYREPIELVADGRFLVIKTSRSNDDGWILVDRESGIVTELDDYPLFSPDHSKFLSAWTTVDNWPKSPQRAGISVFRVGADGVEDETVNFDVTDQWQAINPQWRGNAAIAFTKAFVFSDNNAEPLYKTQTPAVLHFRDGAWDLAPAD